MTRPLRRSRPCSASACAAERVFTIRANHRNLSSRRRSAALQPRAQPGQRRESAARRAPARRGVRAAAAPHPAARLALGAEADVAHQPRDRLRREAERGDQRLVDHRLMLAGARPRGRGAAIRSAMSTRSSCGPTGRKPEPRGRRDVAVGGQHDRAGRRQRRHRRAAAAAARSAARQRIASGFSTAGMNRSSAPIRTPSAAELAALLAVERLERLRDRVARDDPAFVDQHRQHRAQRRRRVGSWPGHAGACGAARASVSTWCATHGLQALDHRLAAALRHAGRCGGRAGRAGYSKFLPGDQQRDFVAAPQDRRRQRQARCAARNDRPCRRPGRRRASHIRRRAAARRRRAASCGRHAWRSGRPRS